MDASQKDETTVSIFRDRTLPFYRIISHPDVLSSLILETPIDTIYTFLFGPSGRRGLSLFRSTATALSEMILGHSSSDEEVSTVAISSSLAVLDRLIEINQSAQVIEGFTAIVETISACIPENFMVPNAQQNLTRIRRRLNIGSSLPLAQTQSTPQNIPSGSVLHARTCACTYAKISQNQCVQGGISIDMEDNDYGGVKLVTNRMVITTEPWIHLFA
ncbi:hypothetical protein ACEPPN_004009 [Leptodophora sp. 'Broadleaf-Isolate-01']